MDLHQVASVVHISINVFVLAVAAAVGLYILFWTKDRYAHRLVYLAFCSVVPMTFLLATFQKPIKDFLAGAGQTAFGLTILALTLFYCVPFGLAGLILRSRRKHIKSYIEECRQLMERGEVALLLERADQVLLIAPELVEVLELKARALRKLGDSESAEVVSLKVQKLIAKPVIEDS